MGGSFLSLSWSAWTYVEPPANVYQVPGRLAVSLCQVVPKRGGTASGSGRAKKATVCGCLLAVLGVLAFTSALLNNIILSQV